MKMSEVPNPIVVPMDVATDSVQENMTPTNDIRIMSNLWYETSTHGLVHPAEAAWRDNAGSGLIFNQHNKDSVETPNYVMKDNNAVCSAYALFLPNLTANLVGSVPAGSTTYTLSSNLFVDGEDLSWVLDIPWAWERSVGAKLARSYSLNENNKVVLTFDESLNPTKSTSKLLCGVKLNHSIYGGFFTGAALSLKGQSSFVGGLYVKNEGSQSFVNGRAIHNTGGRSGIIGEQIFNYADRAFIAGKNMQNEKLGSFLAGEGHVVDSNCKEEIAVFGTFSDLDTDTLFAIGNGTDKDNRSNAFEIKDTGEVLIGADPTEDNGVATKHYVDNVAGGDSNIFVATYGVTTYANIRSAYSDGKIVMMNYNGMTFIGAPFLLSFNFFAWYNPPTTSLKVEIITVTLNNTWTTQTYELQTKDNLVTAISDQSTDTQYPSAKCVYDSLPLIRKGEDAFTNQVTSGYGDLEITFGTAFPTGKVPTVTCSLAANSITNANAGNVSVWVMRGTVSETGFTVRVINNSSTGVTPTIEYIAIA